MTKRKKKTRRGSGSRSPGTRSGAARPDSLATPAIARAMTEIDALLGLIPPGALKVESSAPAGGRELHNWDVVAPAMLFSAASCMLSLRWLATVPPPRREQDASILLRRVYEHVVSFAWIAIDPIAHAKRWVAYDYKYRLKLDDELQAMGASGLLPPARAGFESYIKSNIPMPPLNSRAEAADTYWRPRLAKHFPGGISDRMSLKTSYSVIYRTTSANAHPTPQSLYSYVRAGTTTGSFDIGFDVNLTDVDRFAYTLAPLTFATMLLISEQVLGYPQAQGVFAAFGGSPE